MSIVCRVLVSGGLRRSSQDWVVKWVVPEPNQPFPSAHFLRDLFCLVIDSAGGKGAKKETRLGREEMIKFFHKICIQGN